VHDIIPLREGTHAHALPPHRGLVFFFLPSWTVNSLQKRPISSSLIISFRKKKCMDETRDVFEIVSVNAHRARARERERENEGKGRAMRVRV